MKAYSASITRRKPNKSIFTPRNSPFVFYFPYPINHSHQKRRMIQSLSTIAEHTWLVIIPVLCINCNCYWLLCNSIIKTRTSIQLSEWWYFKLSVFFLAWLSLGHVWICWLCGYPVVFNVLHSVFDKPSSAASIPISWWTIYQLLLW